MAEIDQIISELARSNGWRGLQSRAQFEAAWESFVDQCFKGYEMSIYEFENDRSVRAMIQILLDQDSIQEAWGFEEFKNSISRIDSRFRGILQGGVQVNAPSAPWWERGVPEYAGSELSEDFMNIFGVQVRIGGQD